MFNKPTFGSNTSSFGSFSAGASTSSAFGGFKPSTSGAFGAPASFGTAQPAANNSFFSTPSTGLFGGTAQPSTSSAFGSSTPAGFGGFGATNTSGGLFGANTAGSTGLFGSNQQQNTSAFGAKPGFSFGSTSTPGATTGGLFGGSTNTGGGLFNQQSTVPNTGLFGGTSGGFGTQQQATGTGHVKYNPVVGTDVMVKSGTSQNINTKHHCITCMKEYENKSLEELRLEDYAAGRKGPTNQGVFGAAKPLFGGNTTNQLFNTPATTTAASVFGATNTMGGFGQTSTFAFGGNTQNTNTTNSMFGANKPAFGTTPTTGTGLFGATTTQAPAFGSNTSSFGFGSTAQTQQPSTGMFGSQPAFGANTSFGGFGANTSGMFANKQQTAPAFGTSSATAFGSTSTPFATNTSTSGSLFNANTFKPAGQTGFGFGASQPNTGFGAAAPSFASKPSAFPSLSTTTPMFGQTGANNTFGAGNTSLGGGLGTGLGFGTTPSLGLTQNNSFMQNNTLGSSATGNVHEQILALVARPYGDSALYKDITGDSGKTTDEALKPTNPSAVKAALDNSAYRVSSPNGGRLLVLPRCPITSNDKKSLFDGLEECDASLEDKLSLKPSRKRLVLRQQPRTENTDNIENNHNRSMEDPTSPTNTEQRNKQTENRSELSTQTDRRASVDYQEQLRGVNTDLEDSSEKHNSWLGSSKLPWNDSREKPIDNQPTPRIYPDLDKERPDQLSDRRASWLTTKPLNRKKSAPEQIDAQDSLRELLPRADTRTIHDKENIDHLSVSEEENVSPRDAPPHPTGVKLTRPGYYTIPSLDDMISYIRADGRCVVPHLTIGRKNYGNVYYDCEIDVTGLDLDNLVHFLNKEVVIYPQDSDKPPIGEELNRRAIVTLDRVWPRDKTEKKLVTDPTRLMKMDYEGKLRRVCDKHDTKFIEYRPLTGSWVFRVEHFSKYGLTDSDDEDDITPEVLKRQLVNNNLQMNAAPAPQLVRPPLGLGGSAGEDSLLTMQQCTQTIFNNNSKLFDMEAHDDTTEAQTLYPESQLSAYGVKSPTSELARLENRHSHNVQLMKASLYADTDMDDAMSVSTGDQLVPQPQSIVSLPIPAPITGGEEQDFMMPVEEVEVPEQSMPPLIVQPHTVVLKHHRQVPPSKLTIAGQADYRCIADTLVARGRHFRAQVAPRNTLVYLTTRQNSNLPKSGELPDLGQYVSGRGEDDWSEQLVSTLRLADDKALMAVLSDHLEAHLDFSDITEVPSHAPSVSVKTDPRFRRALLDKHVSVSQRNRLRPNPFGVDGNYWHEVWTLCDALWGADLDNGGVPGDDEQSIVDRHRALISWLTAAVSDMTDSDLASSRPCDDLDPTDHHSWQIWILLVGGRVVEACKVARDSGDLHMAMIIAQASSDYLCPQIPTLQQVITKYESMFKPTDSDEIGDDLTTVGDEETMMYHTLSYLCPQIPTLQQVITKYESMFKPTDGDEIGDDLTIVGDEETMMMYPVPEYQKNYGYSLEVNGKPRRILDLRYELIRARAFNTRPKIQPASYTADPLDYSLAFFVSGWLGVTTPSICESFASQLEANGDWGAAISVLCCLPHAGIRSHLILNTLSRHATSGPIQDMAQKWLQKTPMPRTWLPRAQAYRAKYEHKSKLQLEHLVAAEEWSTAHKVLVDEVLPTVVLADDLDSIAEVMEKMNEAAKRNEIHGWATGGQALYCYMKVCNEVRSIVGASDQDRADIQTRLEAMRPNIVNAAKALQGLRDDTPIHAATRATIATRAANTLSDADWLRPALLPPDCAHHIVATLSTELAEEASRACANSVRNSPYTSRTLAGQS